ncbi:Uroporphyrinogen decarboxylase [Actinidia chinensis var. chinensis]|uniref:Uroporphyrinogen decarboxylase n=1 Tax=Actinidia chinensis var. chinensis TaxID=1590841 RepID=A0A2R6QW51_ACTCC|nr:Uroporphyrinogen decarboxylase [Actinidia chinensis var. chinensis]
MSFSCSTSVSCAHGWKSLSLFVQLGVVRGGHNGVFASRNRKFTSFKSPRACSSSSSDPLLVQAARGDRVRRPPVWMMRRAGRYMAIYRKLAEKHPSFRERSETTDLIVEISLQPWEAFHPDGVIIFSDILSPLPAFSVPLDIDEVMGPVIQSPICSEDGLKALHPIDLDKLHFVGESLRILRQEVPGEAAILGFV